MFGLAQNESLQESISPPRARKDLQQRYEKMKKVLMKVFRRHTMRWINSKAVTKSFGGLVQITSYKTVEVLTVTALAVCTVNVFFFKPLAL